MSAGPSKSTSQPTRKKSNASKEPPAWTSLLKALGYGTPLSSRDKAVGRPTARAFKAVVEQYPATYVTSKNIPGNRLTNWASQQDQFDEMADAFLNQDGNNLLYWPDEQTTKHVRPLQWSIDKELILKNMSQLFFRVNARKGKSAGLDGKDHPAPRDVSNGGPAGVSNLPVANTPIATGRSFTEDVVGRPLAGPSDSAGPVNSHKSQPKSVLPERLEVEDVEEHMRSSPVDLYDGPYSPTQDSAGPADKGKRPAQPYQPEETSRAKRSRLDIGRPASNNNCLCGGDDPVVISSNEASSAASSFRPEEQERVDALAQDVPLPSIEFDAEPDACISEFEIGDYESLPRSSPPRSRRGATDETLGRSRRQLAPMAAMEEHITSNDLDYLLPLVHAVQQEAQRDDTLHQPASAEQTAPPDRGPVSDDSFQAESIDSETHSPIQRTINHHDHDQRLETLQQSEPPQTVGPERDAPDVEQPPPPQRNITLHINMKISAEIVPGDYRRCQLRRSFMQTSLQELIDGIPFKSQPKGLSFMIEIPEASLELPEQSFDDYVLLENEEDFAEIKQRFYKRILRFFKHYGIEQSAPRPLFEILITPWQDEGLGRKRENTRMVIVF